MKAETFSYIQAYDLNANEININKKDIKIMPQLLIETRDISKGKKSIKNATSFYPEDLMQDKIIE